MHFRSKYVTLITNKPKKNQLDEVCSLFPIIETDSSGQKLINLIPIQVVNFVAKSASKEVCFFFNPFFHIDDHFFQTWRGDQTKLREERWKSNFEKLK